MLTACQVNPHQFSARVVDFGLARSSSPAQRISENMYGTITHMAPEMMAGASASPVRLALHGMAWHGMAWHSIA